MNLDGRLYALIVVEALCLVLECWGCPALGLSCVGVVGWARRGGKPRGERQLETQRFDHGVSYGAL
jgi:hypothetical protein